MASVKLIVYFCFVTVFYVKASTNSSETTKVIVNDTQCKNFRTGRRFVPHGLAFLSGVKVGAFLAHRDSDVGHGSFASSHSFKLFGKPINTAISLSYGGYHLPQVHEVSDDEPVDLPITNQTKSEDPLVQVTVINHEVRDLTKSTRPGDDLEQNSLKKDHSCNKKRSSDLEFFKLHNANVAKINQLLKTKAKPKN